MNNTDLQGFTEELQALRDKISAMEAILQEAKKQEDEDPLRTFEVVLRVTTRASTWGQGWVDEERMLNQFADFSEDIRDTVCLRDPGDSIKVHRVIEVKQNY